MNEQEKQALSKCMAICSKAEKCVSEIQKKLDQWGIAFEASKEIIDYLIKEKFIDERRYSMYFVKDKFRFNQWGRIKISYQMKLKQIPVVLINEALCELDDDEYFSFLNKLIQGKANKIKSKNDFEKRAKLTRYAQSKGFEYDLIAKAIDKLD